MITNIDEVLTKIDKIPLQLEQFTLKVLKAVGAHMLDGSSSRTPVDTGWARASWRVGIGSEDASTAPRGNFQAKAFYGQITRADARSKAEPYIASQRAKLEGLDKINTVYITNRVPYIGDLENGSSRQARQGMVAVTLNSLKERIASLGVPK